MGLGAYENKYQHFDIGYKITSWNIRPTEGQRITRDSKGSISTLWSHKSIIRDTFDFLEAIKNTKWFTMYSERSSDIQVGPVQHKTI